MEFRTLGGVEALSDGEALRLGGPKQRILLGVLLANRRSVVTSEALAEALWGDEPPPTARATLQTHLSKLRRILAASGSEGADLVNRPPGYLLDVNDHDVDADLFEGRLARARGMLATDAGGAVAELDRALELWRGPAFAEFAHEAWAMPEAVRLEELRLVAVEVRNDARLAIGEHAIVVSELEGLLGEHPLREKLWSQHMVALDRSGRQAEALRVGNVFRSHLRDELGLEPSSGFVEVERGVASGKQSTPDFASAPAGPSSAGAEPNPVATAPGRLPPARRSPFGHSVSMAEMIGREDDVSQAFDALLSSRVVTLTGTGGVGKSTMAAAVARVSADSYRDGTAVVELAPVHEEAGVLAAVAHCLEVERRGELSLVESVIEALGAQKLLLVLDNCEHVLEIAGDLVVRLVRWCPGVRILVTSREPLAVPGEVVRPVLPLGVPAASGMPLDQVAEAAAVQVFVARATEASPGFELTTRNAAAVAELCIQLDGLPLALELAAARMSSMSPGELAERLHGRFALLGPGPGREGRHRTLVDVVQWSFELLEQDEQTLFGRLSVFAGGFDLGSAEQTCGLGTLAPDQVARLLAALVDKSLVVAEADRYPRRYHLLETLRQFAAARLGEQAEAIEVQRAHLATFVELAERAEVGMDSPDEAEWVARVDADLGNLRAAVITAVGSADGDSALRLVAAVRELAIRRMRYEIVDWAHLATEVDGVQEHPLLPTALGLVAYGSFVRGDLRAAVEIADRAVDARRSLGVPSSGLPERVLANSHFYLGERVVAMDWMRRMVEAAGPRGAVALAHALYMQSVAATSVGDPAEGARLAEASQEEAERSANPTSLSQAAYARGLAAAGTDPAAALVLLEEAAVTADGVDNRWMRAFSMTESLWLRAQKGDVSEALGGYADVVETWFRAGDWANQWLSLRQLAGVLVAAGKDEDAALLFGSVAAAGAATALPIAPMDAEDLDGAAQVLMQRLGPHAIAEANRRGAAMRDDAVVALALRSISELP